MAKNSRYCVHVHTFTSGRSFLLAMMSLVACCRSVPNVSALAAISYKSQKVFEFYRQTDRHVHVYFTMDFLQIRLARRNLNFANRQTDRQTYSCNQGIVNLNLHEPAFQQVSGQHLFLLAS